MTYRISINDTKKTNFYPFETMWGAQRIFEEIVFSYKRAMVTPITIILMDITTGEVIDYYGA